MQFSHFTWVLLLIAGLSQDLKMKTNEEHRLIPNCFKVSRGFAK